MPDVPTSETWSASCSSGGAETPEAAEERPAILLVEDEPIVAMLLEEVLSTAGYRILAAAPNGPSALAAAAAAPAGPAGLRAAVVDLRLDGRMDGREVIRRLREARPGLPVVVVTGYGPGDPKADLRGLGGPTRRLGKPVDFADLLIRLSSAIAAHDVAAAGGASTTAALPQTLLRRRDTDDPGVARPLADAAKDGARGAIQPAGSLADGRRPRGTSGAIKNSTGRRPQPRASAESRATRRG